MKKLTPENSVIIYINNKKIYKPDSNQKGILKDINYLINEDVSMKSRKVVEYFFDKRKMSEKLLNKL